ncbi:myosin IC heavy chain-like [Balaenoptera musculus]|uniref:Myosin IC heavy chain-like n=1 Tax=Balaenoptera musculus TaxID=9771 RepID=A0A8B8YBT8_BALMU|nr:myosin IC heavy chain-like [Balaenoptera musculus]
MAAGPGDSWAEGAGGGRGARGPALSHPGRLGPGRAAAPDAGTGRSGPDYALGKSPIHGARPFPSATGLGPRSRAGGRPRAAGRASLASPLLGRRPPRSARTRALSPSPPRDHFSPERRLPRTRALKAHTDFRIRDVKNGMPCRRGVVWSKRLCSLLPSSVER